MFQSVPNHCIDIPWWRFIGNRFVGTLDKDNYCFHYYMRNGIEKFHEKWNCIDNKVKKYFISKHPRAFVLMWYIWFCKSGCFFFFLSTWFKGKKYNRKFTNIGHSTKQNRTKLTSLERVTTQPPTATNNGSNLWFH